MATYKIITDSGCDLPKAKLQEMDVQAIPLSVNFMGQTREDTVEAGIEQVYEGLRKGEKASTSAINPTRWAEAMEAVLQQEQDVLVIAFSSGLSRETDSSIYEIISLADES